MRVRGWLGKGWISFMILSFVVALLPVGLSSQVEAASEDVEVFLGGARLGNKTHGAQNAVDNFHQGTAGFSEDSNKGDVSGGGGDIYVDYEEKVTLTLRVKDNPLLKELASSGHAVVEYGWDSLVVTVKEETVEDEHMKSSGRIYVYSETELYNPFLPDLSDSADGTSSTGSKSGSSPLEEDTIIRIEIEAGEENSEIPAGVRGLYVRFKDETRPVLNGYTFTGNGAERLNPNTGQTELYVKENEYIDLTYKFSEAVRPHALVADFSDHFLRHPLFVNPSGTGLPAAGQQQYLRNTTYTSSTLKELHNRISYRYTGVKYHHSDNLPLTPDMTGTEDEVNPMYLTLEEKLNQAVLADAAGNVATIDLTHKADSSSNSTIRGKAVNPFDYENEGYRIIVDAVAPKYTKTGNGIQPEILTGVVLNENDTIEYTVQFTEEVVVKRGWDLTRTYLLLSNGMKAYYRSGEGTKAWKFSMNISDDKIQESPLLKAIALTHDNKQTDTLVLQDYAGNMLIQPANYDGVHVDGDESLLNSKIDWADLSIDNTAPDITFRFEDGGATNIQYQKNGKITVDANDPTLLVPPLDPVNTGMLRPSKGIYRPSNMTGEASPAVGLVYYYWSQSDVDPFDGKEDHFAAVKRYSLSAKQPREDLYPDEFADLNLSAANNKTNLLAPPAEARLPENSGEWYLHAWTADMTWDSARELMQYEKMKSYVQENSDKYEAWKQELPDGASDQDREFYAETMALAAVGQYGDLETWPLEDFKQDDSNWTHEVTEFLLDNQHPQVIFEGAQDDRTKEVRVSIAVSDPHSGVDEALYQFVEQGEAPSDEDWQTLELDGDGRVTVSTLNNVFVDGAYTLYVKSADHAGNGQTVAMEQAVTVDSTSSVRTIFFPDADPGYVQAHDIEFTISGMTPTNNEIAYAVTSSSLRPTNDGDYLKLVGTTVTGDVYGEGTVPDDGGTVTGDVYGDGGGLRFVIPGDASRNGLQYVHIVADPEDEDRLYTYVKAYYFDNTAPEITFNRSGSVYPSEEQVISAAVIESLSVDGLMHKYQWVRDGEAPPNAASDGWLEWPVDGVMKLTNESLASGEMADYRLYVYAVDGAGNEAVEGTDPFRISKPNPEAPPSSGESQLLYVYYSGVGAYTAIIKLDLDAVDKRGYEYSLSPDGGTSWTSWKDYTNFVSVEVPTEDPELLDIQVKFRVGNGDAGEPLALQADTLSDIEPVYALASLNTTRDVRSELGVDLLITPGLGVRVTPGAENPTVPERLGNSNSFKIRENGYYSFTLTDLTDATRTDTLYVVVDNIDDTPPTGEAVLLSTLPTNQNVSARLLNTSEPVRIVNNEGRNVYTFTENGTFTFEFVDEAGNVGTATATVTSIDKEAPNVRIVKSYQYGEGADDVFGTILDGSGDVAAASGVVLRVESEDAQSFSVVGGASSVVMRENGTASFIVSDAYGNTAKVTETVSFLVNEPPQPQEIAYVFVDAEGQPLDESQIVTIDGQAYAKGKLQVTITGQTNPNNLVFEGMIPMELSEGGYSNQISGNDGAFQLTRVYDRNGAKTIAMSDLLGNRNKVPVFIEGLDNTPPEIILNRSVTAVAQGQENFDFRTDLGGYTVSDNVSKPEDIQVEMSGLDLNGMGEQQVTYTVTDQVGNQTTIVQKVIVTSQEGMLTFVDGQLISSVVGETALFDTTRLTFDIEGYNRMTVDGVDRTNEAGTYDLLYYSGLYREGQMKYIATKLSYEELVNGSFTVTFPKAGWYTIIVRNQEREREYTTFFINSEVPE